MKKNVLALIALIAVFALLLAGCGKQQAPEETVNSNSDVLGLFSWTMTASAWSSNNGATVTLTATPNYYKEGQTAAFVIRLEGEDVENVACAWDGKAYTAEADLNAADGLCYYVVITDADGQQAEVAVNTPTQVTDEDLINMAHALETYCHMAVTKSALNGDMLTVISGDAQIVLPRITRDGQAAACEKAELVLRYREEEVDRQNLPLPGDVSLMEVTGINFTVPQMEDDEQLMLTLEVTLTDGQVLTAPACTWFYTDHQLVPAVG